MTSNGRSGRNSAHLERQTTSNAIINNVCFVFSNYEVKVLRLRAQDGTDGDTPQRMNFASPS